MKCSNPYAKTCEPGKPETCKEADDNYEKAIFTILVNDKCFSIPYCYNYDNKTLTCTNCFPGYYLAGGYCIGNLKF